MRVDSLIDPGSLLGELVAERPARTQLFEQLRLDYCCGGHQTLAAACAKRGLELEEVLAALHAIDERGLESASVEDRDWRRSKRRSCAPTSSRCTTRACVMPSPGSSACLPPWSGFTATASRGSATLSVASARSEASWSRTWPARRTCCSRLASPPTRRVAPSKSLCSRSTNLSTRRLGARSVPCGSCAATTIARPRSATPTERSSTRWRPSSRISTATFTRRTTFCWRERDRRARRRRLRLAPRLRLTDPPRHRRLSRRAVRGGSRSRRTAGRRGSAGADRASVGQSATGLNDRAWLRRPDQAEAQSAQGEDQRTALP